mmetsp:Transcript_9559/g.21714  ORF Transcript_9559/g.21714 Transcript_9559/m.21714 type:complete len:99 (+) Transcript_9559:1863-2159(+)
MSLHDLPWPRDALEHAFGLLREGGRVVVAHPKGAAHVVMQNRRSPEMVPNLLPTADELEVLVGEWNESGGGLELEVRPAPPGSPQDKEQGYLAVIAVR